VYIQEACGIKKTLIMILCCRFLELVISMSVSLDYTVPTDKGHHMYNDVPGWQAKSNTSWDTVRG
jgi:hypothetical protein